MGAPIRTTSPAMESHFLLMIFNNETMSLRPSFPSRRLRGRNRKKQSACRATLDFHGRGKKWTVERSKKQRRRWRKKVWRRKKRGAHDYVCAPRASPVGGEKRE